MLYYTAVAARGLLGAIAGSAILERQQYSEEYMRDPGLDWTFDLVQDFILSKNINPAGKLWFLNLKRGRQGRPNMVQNYKPRLEDQQTILNHYR